jgi:hypothetical protein
MDAAGRIRRGQRMNPDLQNIATAAQSTLVSVDAVEQTIEGQSSQIASLAQQNGVLQGQLSAAQARLDALTNATVFDGLELTPWLLAPGTAANTGSTGSTAVATQAQPGITSAWFNLAPAGPWANAYWYKKFGVWPKKNTFTYELSFLFGTAGDSAASNCVELDIQQVISGLGFNPGWQFDFNENLLRVWDRDRKQKGLPEPWISTGHPCPRWIAGQWVHIVAENHRDGANVYHDAMTINGNRIPINMMFPATPLALPDMLNCAVQLDGNKAGTAYKLYIDRVKFTAS